MNKYKQIGKKKLNWPLCRRCETGVAVADSQGNYCFRWFTTIALS